MEAVQKFEGKFNVTFWSIPVFSVSKTTATAKNGGSVNVYALHFTSFFAISFACSNVEEKETYIIPETPMI